MGLIHTTRKKWGRKIKKLQGFQWTPAPGPCRYPLENYQFPLCTKIWADFENYRTDRKLQCSAVVFYLANNMCDSKGRLLVLWHISLYEQQMAQMASTVFSKRKMSSFSHTLLCVRSPDGRKSPLRCQIGTIHYNILPNRSCNLESWLLLLRRIDRPLIYHVFSSIDSACPGASFQNRSYCFGYPRKHRVFEEPIDTGSTG
jgi:hypothetical protein